MKCEIPVSTLMGAPVVLQPRVLAEVCSDMSVEANTKVVEGFVTIRADTFLALVNSLDVLM